MRPNITWFLACACFHIDVDACAAGKRRTVDNTLGDILIEEEAGLAWAYIVD